MTKSILSSNGLKFQGAIVFSNIVTTVSPTYAQEVRTVEVLRPTFLVTFATGAFLYMLNGTVRHFLTYVGKLKRLLYHLHSFILTYGQLIVFVISKQVLKFHEQVGCITRLVPQKGVHLIRHAIYCALELGGQFVLLGSSPVPHIQVMFLLSKQ
ncbi:hypothetical protein B296_00040724 [Ensete ventricosum]|uniref:starch synthase n=1 Tax=Ensete ventricosum TaxID=4639 RepID=A0A426ZPI1_ENSVE|nr:hypothetical protein B296_00040724 [Ensete ventricosum]